MSAITSEPGAARAARWLLLALAASGAVALAAPPRVGDSAPALVFQTFAGEPFDLAAMRGKVVIVNFWASWCQPCREEMPALDAMASEQAARGLVVVGLSADDRHDRSAARDIASRFHYALGMLDGAAANGFGAPAMLPLSYVVGRDGRIAGVIRPRREGVVGELRDAASTALADAATGAPE